MKSQLSSAEINAIINTSHKDPFQILGIHEIEVNGKKKMVVRRTESGSGLALTLDIKFFL